MKIKILVPTYGKSPWIEEALKSVLMQNDPDWQLEIADDGMCPRDREWLSDWKAQNSGINCIWEQRESNLGLFANLNKAIKESEAGWFLILCSDDYLLPNAIAKIKLLVNQWPDSELILSTFYSIDALGNRRKNDSGYHHDQVQRCTGLIEPERMIPSLLKLGSLNGNLTGMVFTKTLWEKAGKFKEDWTHAADWEWLIRACEVKPVVLNREPIANVRTHEYQLSNKNRKSGRELIEMAEVVKLLKSHDLLAKNPNKESWSADIMQHQLWNSLKSKLVKGENGAFHDMEIIKSAASMKRTSMKLLLSIPGRIIKKIKGDYQ